jgi:hypothetical protein
VSLDAHFILNISKQQKFVLLYDHKKHFFIVCLFLGVS